MVWGVMLILLGLALLLAEMFLPSGIILILSLTTIATAVSSRRWMSGLRFFWCI